MYPKRRQAVNKQTESLGNLAFFIGTLGAVISMGVMGAAVVLVHKQSHIIYLVEDNFPNQVNYCPVLHALLHSITVIAAIFYAAAMMEILVSMMLIIAVIRSDATFTLPWLFLHGPAIVLYIVFTGYLVYFMANGKCQYLKKILFGVALTLILAAWIYSRICRFYLVLSDGTGRLRAWGRQAKRTQLVYNVRLGHL